MSKLRIQGKVYTVGDDKLAEVGKPCNSKKKVARVKKLKKAKKVK